MLHRARSKDAHFTFPLRGASCMTSEQGGDSSSATSLPAPSNVRPQDSQKQWAAAYLSDLRSNRTVRPTGSRPLPSRNATTLPTSESNQPPRLASVLSRPVCSTRQTEPGPRLDPERSASAMSHRQATSVLSMGRPLVRRPEKEVKDEEIAPSSIVEPSATYRERGQRWMEKQEAQSLREALQDMDLQKEQQIHTAAQEEATDLVWKHRNPGASHNSRDAPYDYRQHLRKGSHARYTSIAVNQGALEQSRRAVSDGSNSGSGIPSESRDAHIPRDTRTNEPRPSGETTIVKDVSSYSDWDSPQKKAYMKLSFSLPSVKPSNRRRSSGQKSRNSSGGSKTGLFKNPEDQIYEEPNQIHDSKYELEDPSAKPAPLRPRNRNSSLKINSLSGIEKDQVAVEPSRPMSRFEIHRNPPSQSRDPFYVQNLPSPTPPDSSSSIEGNDLGRKSSTTNDIEIRGEDIRAATSKSLKDRSPKLPTPTAVSDRPGRPIVSFDHDWRSRQPDSKHEPSSRRRASRDGGNNRAMSRLGMKPSLPESTASAPIIPTINVPEPPSISISEAPSIPSINFPGPPNISISTPEERETKSSVRPLPNPASRFKINNKHKPDHRPQPHHSSTAPIPTSHWSPASSRRVTAQCSSCALPISGRIVSAASQRFHPACFSCFECSELLECVAFYPEPENKRAARLLPRDVNNNDNDANSNETNNIEILADQDPTPRFYCHLDYHELFSPRCRSCKTPIEGEVILACGGEWHAGHFFCAECGDPFDSTTPFVERDGYAWCVACHAGRFSGKCRGCRKPVMDGGVQALGAEWHEACFVCGECGGGFGDGRFFTRGEGGAGGGRVGDGGGLGGGKGGCWPVCVGCEERRLKA